MHYLSAKEVSKSYGIKPLFSKLSFHINEGDKIALVARNGSGKSTLLKMLMGLVLPDDGIVWKHKEVKIVLLNQEPEINQNETALENIFSHKNETIDAIKEYELLVEKNETEALMPCIEKMDQLGAWDFEAKVKNILSQLKIDFLTQLIKTLSGGQQKRIALAKVLIDIGFEASHTLLILDEPTNHLDVEMIEWLEFYIEKENMTLLMVTHDRYFLDAVSNEIWEIDNEQLYTYQGNYENYLIKKNARIESQISTIDKAKNTYKKELEWMRKQPKARTTKSKSRTDNFYEIEKIAKQQQENNQLTLQMKMSRLGGKIAEFKKVYKSFNDKPILKGFDYTFSKGERIGIIGKNGTGKTTFINLLQEIEKPDSGKINIGDTVVFGNFSQKGLILKENERVIEFVKNIAENFPLAGGGSMSASQFLQLFLFEGDKQYSYINTLSGGEKKRLQLLSILFTNPNFLILDEPTNDLDLPTLQVLEDFLMEYSGCLIVISHDRYFMDKLIDHLLVFEGEGMVTDYPGNYTQYRIDKQLKQELKPIATPTPLTNNLKTVDQKTKKGSFKEKREFELLNKEMDEIEMEKKSINFTLSTSSLPFDEINKLTNRMAEISKLQDYKETRWLELSELLES